MNFLHPAAPRPPHWQARTCAAPEHRKPNRGLTLIELLIVPVGVAVILVPLFPDFAVPDEGPLRLASVAAHNERTLAVDRRRIAMICDCGIFQKNRFANLSPLAYFNAIETQSQ